MLARLFVIVGGLFVLALVSALVAPYFVDWSSYRADFEREASAVLGRKVTVEGAAEVRLLPFPSVTFADVAVGAGSGEPAMTVDTFSMDAELAPLLHGEFLIFDMRLVRPRAVVEVAPDGTVDWAARPSTPVEPGRIAVENLSVTDGEIVLRHGGSGREHRISDIDARLSARSLAGPWSGSATLNFDARRIRLSGSTGAAENGRLRLRLDATPDATPLHLSTDGALEVTNGAASYSGRFHMADVPLPAAAEPAPEGQAEAESAVRVEGDFKLDSRGIEASTFRFERGPREDPYTAEGEASLVFALEPRFAVQARGNQIRLNAPADQPANAGLSLAERLAALEQAIGSLPRPTIPGTVDLDLPALVAGDTTVRDLKLVAEPEAAGWRIRSLSASLPGRTTLEAGGLVSADGAPGFEGSLLLAVAQPSGFAAWLGRDVDDAVRNLPSAGFSAKVKLGASRQSFSDLEIVLGSARLKGSAESRMPAGERPSLTVQLAGGRIDLSQADAFASLLIGEKGLSGLGSRDLDLAFKAGPLQAGAFTAGSVDAALKLNGAGLSVQRLALRDLAGGAAVEASGSFSGAENARKGELTGRVSAPDLAPLVAAAARQFPANGFLRWLDTRAKDFSGLLAGTELKLALLTEPSGRAGPQVRLTASGTAGGSELGLSLSSRTWLADWGKGELVVEGSARNPDGAPLLALAGLHAIPLGLTGPAELTFSAQGVPSAGVTAQAALSADKFVAAFNGAISPLAVGGVAVKGPLSLSAENVEPWMQTLGAGLPGFGLGTASDLTADADYADGLLVLSDARGSFDGASVAGDINIALADGLPEITGALSLDSLDLIGAATVLLGPGAFDQAPDGAMATPFRATSATAFTAGLSVTAGSLEAGALGTLSDASFTLSLDPDRLALGALSATFRGGRLKGAAELKNDGGTGSLAAQFDLRGAGVAASARNAALGAKGDFSATLSGSGASVEALVGGLNGSGTATLHDFTLSGISGAALPQLLAGGDAAGPVIDAAAVERFALPLVQGGTFSAERADFAFNVGNGVLRTPPFSVSNADAALRTDLRADLKTRTLTVRGRLAYDPGPQAQVGSDPSIGLLLEGRPDDAELRFDMTPLAQFLVQRRLEREQARVEELQAALLEKQRLRREVRFFRAESARRAQEAAARAIWTEAARLRVADRAAVEAAQARRTVADEAETRQAAEAEEAIRRKVEAAIRLAEAERARQRGSSRPASGREEPPPVPSARKLNLEALQPAIRAQP